MPIDANSFNSRITSEALEQKFRNTFPAQAGAELIQDLYASGTITPIVDFTSTALGSELRPEFQQAWDFSTTQVTAALTGSTPIVSTAGFWKVDLNYINASSSSTPVTDIHIFDGATEKPVWKLSDSFFTNDDIFVVSDKFYVFLRSGDSLRCKISAGDVRVDIWARQVADLYGNLTNPTGYSPQ